jgi:hypothetical protein
MLDTQNQGPQCTACGSIMRLTAIERARWAKTCERLLVRNVKGFSGTSSKAL